MSSYNIYGLENCFSGLDTLSDNSVFTLNDDITCASGYSLSGFSNLTINCNSNSIRANGGFFKVDSSVDFINCSLITSDTISYDFSDAQVNFYNSRLSRNNHPNLLYIDNLNTNVVFNNHIDTVETLTSSINFSNTFGTYEFREKFKFLVRDTNSVIIPFYDVNMTAHINILDSSSTSSFSYKNTDYFLLYQSINGIAIKYLNFNVTVISPELGSYLMIPNLNFRQDSTRSFMLNDLVGPKVTVTQGQSSNVSLKFNFNFSEKVTGIIEIRNSTGPDYNVLFSQNIFLVDVANITFNNLEPNTVYRLNVDVHDESNNDLEGGFTGTHNYQTYATLNYSINDDDGFTYLGNPQNSTWFRFYSNVYNKLFVEFEGVNLTNKNYSKEINILSNNLIYINSSSYFNRPAKLFFYGLNQYQSLPVILKDGSVCNLPDCVLESFNLSTKNLIFNVTGFSNYSTISNSVLDVYTDAAIFADTFNIYANFSRYNDSTPISLNTSCYLYLNDQILNLSYNPLLFVYNKSILINNSLNNAYEVSCVSLNYDDKTHSDDLNLSIQEIDDFNINLSVIKTGDTTSSSSVKLINISINSSGINNSLSSTVTKYYFMVTKNVNFPQTGWSNSNLSGWVNVGKNEKFTIFAIDGVDKTFVNLSNGSQINFSNYVFLDEKWGTVNPTNLYVVVKACVPAESSQECKYSSTSKKLVFQDITPPESLFTIDFPNYYNILDNINFTFNVRDLESKISTVKYELFYDDGTSVSNNLIPISFNEGVNTTYSDLGLNFLDGERYTIELEVKNKNDISKTFSSNSFLIDTLKPINSTFNISSLNHHNYLNSTFVNMSFYAGKDNDTHGLEVSGLERQEIYVKNASLIDNTCVNYGEDKMLNFTLNITNTTYSKNYTQAHCYDFSYYVYDKATNLNVVNFNTVKIDTSIPQVNNVFGMGVETILTIEDGIDVNISTGAVKYNMDFLTQGGVIVNLKWNITDFESGMDYYKISVYDETNPNYYVITTNHTTSNYNFLYNETIFIHGHDYRFEVVGVNNAGLESNVSSYSGFTFLIEKIPQTILKNKFLLGPNEVFDYLDDNKTTIFIQDKYFFNSTCKVYKGDKPYSSSTGSLCSRNGIDSTCEINNSKLGWNDYSISCITFDNVTDTWNNVTNNLDFRVYVEENVLPTIVDINGDSNFSDTFEISEDGGLFELDFNFDDMNTMTYFLRNYSKELYPNLYVKANISDIVAKDIKIKLIQNPLVSNNNLTIENNNYVFNYFPTISHLDIINLNLNNKDSVLDFYSTNVSQEFGPGQNFTFADASYTTHGGISNNIKNISIMSDYNITLDDFGHLIWDSTEFVGRKGQVNFTLNLTDELDSEQRVFYINVTPIYYNPEVDTDYLNMNGNNFFEIHNNKYFTFNISKYFIDTNGVVGLDSTLTYNYGNFDDFNVLSFNSTTGIITLKAKSGFVGNSSLKIYAFNVVGGKNSTLINFTNITKYLTAPSFNLTFPMNNSLIHGMNKTINFTLISNMNLSSIDVISNGVLQNLCSGSCSNIFNSSVYIPSLKEGTNSFEFIIADLYDNYNNKTYFVDFFYDSDGDGIIDLLDPNLDNDGFLDSIDGIWGDHTSYYSNIKSSYLRVNNSFDLSLNYYNLTRVDFVDNNSLTYVEFDYNFTNSSLDLRGVSIIYNNLSNSLIISDLNITGTKNIFVPKPVESSFSSVCIKDSNIYSLASMSESCTGADETLLLCDGVTRGNYSCTLQTQQGTYDFWKITGLKHSAVKVVCSEMWTYGNWSDCSGSTQIRTATDSNSCGTTSLREVISKSCSMPSSGSSGGGGGGGSKKKPIPVVENSTINETKTNVTIPEVEVEIETPIIDTIKPIFIANLYSDSFSKEIEIDKLYSFKVLGDVVEGTFVIDDDFLIFKATNGNFGFSIQDSKEIDIDKDGKNDIKLEFSKENDLIYLSGETIIESPIETIFENSTQIPTPIPEESNNMLIISIVILIILVIVAVVGFVVYRKHYPKYAWQNTYPSNRSPSENAGLSGVYQPTKINEAIFEEELEKYSIELKNLANSSTSLITKIEKEFRDLIKKGYSWVEVYYFLRHKNISEYFIRKIINFDFLVHKFEIFFHEFSDLGLGGEEIKRRLLKQEWIKECYFYDGDGKEILRNLLFMLAGANIYGFSKEKFLNLLNNEFDTGLKNYSKTLSEVDFNKMDLSVVDIHQLEDIETNFRTLKTKVDSLSVKLREVNCSESRRTEYKNIIDIMLKNINIYSK